MERMQSAEVSGAEAASISSALIAALQKMGAKHGEAIVGTTMTLARLTAPHAPISMEEETAFVKSLLSWTASYWLEGKKES